MAAGYCLCHDCHQLNKIAPDHDEAQYDLLCSRCHASLHPRLSNSISRTWALLLTAMILFIPANIYPIMIVDTIAGKVESTIMEGIVVFIQSREYFVAIVIFIASIIVPAIKLVGLAIILYSIQKDSRTFRRHRSLMYRFIQFIGRWSMLDIFVVSIMVAIVNFGVVSQIYAGMGAVAFALVVIITMYAAITFDPRLIWDNGNYHGTVETKNNKRLEDV